jgi:hypothetical protein
MELTSSDTLCGKVNRKVLKNLKMAYPEDKKRMKVFIRSHLYGKR